VLGVDGLCSRCGVSAAPPTRSSSATSRRRDISSPSKAEVKGVKRLKKKIALQEKGVEHARNLPMVFGFVGVILGLAIAKGVAEANTGSERNWEAGTAIMVAVIFILVTAPVAYGLGKLFERYHAKKLSTLQEELRRMDTGSEEAK
jgi:hypothetical protein